MTTTAVHPRIIGAVLAVMASSAWAQYRVGDQGHAADANNRLGSGGYNAPTDLSGRGQAATNGQILNGNSNGLSYFHGNAQTFDPNTLQTNTGTGNSDRLNAIAAPVNLEARSTAAPQQVTVTPFYSTATVNQLPAPNYVQTPGGVGLVPAPAPVQQSNDLRLGVIDNVTNNNTLPAPGQFAQPGQVDNSAQASPMSASPLYGIRAWRSDDPNDQYFLSRSSNTALPLQGQGTQMNNAQIQQMRNELNSTIVDPQTGAANADNSGTSTPQQGTGLNTGQPTPQGQQVNSSALRNQSLNRSATALNSGALPNELTNTALTQSPTSGDLSTNQGTHQTLLVPPAKQSTQLADLERRLNAYKGPVSDQQADLNYNTALRLKQASDAAAKKQEEAGGQTSGAAGLTPGSNQPIFVAPPTASAKPAAKPVTPNVINGPLGRDENSNASDYVVTSLATGVKAAGLAKLMRSAETDMRDGKFTAALDSYDTAAAVAPNNPFVTLGRGFAELGASYYGKSEGDLRRSFTAEPAVLVGRYDLNGFLGEDRVHFVVGDLRDIANTEKSSSRPLFLLAYLEHNLGDDATAKTDLAEAQRRTGGSDAVIAQMQKLWGMSGK